MLSPKSRRRALGSALALAVVVPLAVGATSVATASPNSGVHKADPVNTRPSDGVLYRQSFNDLAKDLQARSSDPGITDGTVGFTHSAPKGWSVENDESMAGIGVDEWRGWSFTTRDFWTDAEDQMRYRFARADTSWPWPIPTSSPTAAMPRTTSGPRCPPRRSRLPASPPSSSASIRTTAAGPASLPP
ncbi:hypothetical protein [Crystallibacter crystallopoietes]|uniref:hypothetical protein n=1 Tax=Crystallibacter crystallopoietes TaxID=37928 RepID=UPI00307C84E0